ncbi:MAG TPA: FecR family protein [Rhodocyclaceae bacterium]
MSSISSPLVRHNSLRLAVCGLSLLVAAAYSLSARAAEAAGTVMASTGQVEVIDSGGGARKVARGSPLNQGDRIVTGRNGLVQIRMADGSYLSVRSNTEMALDRFEVDMANDHKASSFLISLVKGGLRAITGLIGRSNPDAYKVRTPTATIGVRGTDHEPMYIPDASPVFSALGAPGVYDKVNDGESYIQSAAGIVALKVGQIGHVGRPQEVPVLLKVVPSFYQVDVKIDARPKEDFSVRRPLPTAAKPLLLRPTISSRVATPAAKLDPAATTSVIGGTTTLAPKLSNTTTLSTSTLSTTTKDLTSSTTTLDPSLSTSTLSTTTLTSPTLSTSTTTLDPSLSTSTLSTTTLTSPTLSTTTTTSPTTTISPTLSTSTLSTTTLTSPTLSTTTTTTTTSPTLLNSTTLTSPTLSTTIQK